MPYPSPPCPTTMTYLANTPFHVQHGWAISWPHGSTPSQKAGLGSSDTNFTLYVDGTQASYTMYRHLNKTSGVMDKWYLSNFPSGMTGTHVFLGEWFNDSSLVLTCQIDVTFT